MVRRLGATLDIPLRDQNVMLDAAGFAREFAEPSFEDGLPEPVSKAIDRMMQQQEPFPLVAMNPRYDVLRSNRGAQALLRRIVLDPARLTQPVNLLRMLFDPHLARSFVCDWQRVAGSLLSRLHREVLSRPGNGEMAALLRELLAFPDVPESLRHPDFSTPSEAVLAFRLERGDLELAFLTTMTVFNAPQDVTLEEVRLESYVPLDEATQKACERLVRES